MFLCGKLGHLGRSVSSKYDVSGRLVKAVDPLGGAVLYEYDSRGLKTKETGHDNRSVFYAYDSAGRLVSSRDGAVRGRHKADFLKNGWRSL